MVATTCVAKQLIMWTSFVCFFNTEDFESNYSGNHLDQGSTDFLCKGPGSKICKSADKTENIM